MSDPLDAKKSDCGETEREVEGGEEEVDAESGPAIFTGKLAQALRE